MQAKVDKKRIRELERNLNAQSASRGRLSQREGTGGGGGIAGTVKKVECPLGRRRGELTPVLERQQLVGWLNEAALDGARKAQACAEVGLTLRTLQRWRACPTKCFGHGRR